jgi:hypothetical protein
MSVTGANSAMVYRCAVPSASLSPEVPNWLKRTLSLRTNAEVSVTSRLHLCDLVRPMSVFLIALAVAVAVWGFAYKLSLYQPPHKHPLQVSVAKMWLGSERQPGLSAIHTTRSHFGPTPSTQLDSTISPMPPFHSEESRWSPSQAEFAATGGSFLFGSAHVCVCQCTGFAGICRSYFLNQ